MTALPTQPPENTRGLAKTILLKLSGGVGAILAANETLKAIREQINRLQSQLIEVIGSLNYHTAKIEDLERRLAETEIENRLLRERLETVERAHQYQAGRLDEAARRGG